MKVRILSGNNRGQIVEMPRTEAEVNIATGYAEAVKEEPVPVPMPKKKPAEGATRPGEE
jgi:hypothetical protein